MIDAGSFSDLEGIPVNDRARLSGLLSLESKLTDILGFPIETDEAEGVTQETTEDIADSTEDDEAQLTTETDDIEDGAIEGDDTEATAAEGAIEEQPEGVSMSRLPKGGFGYLGRIPQGASPALSARALVLRKG